MALDQSALSELLDALRAGTGDLDLVRSGLQLVLQALIEMEAAQAVGAGPYQRSPERTTHRNGHRERLLSTKAGDLQLRIPKLRSGSFFPSLLEPRRRIDRALWAVVMEAYVHGVSTRKAPPPDEARALPARRGAGRGLRAARPARGGSRRPAPGDGRGDHPRPPGALRLGDPALQREPRPPPTGAHRGARHRSMLSDSHEHAMLRGIPGSSVNRRLRLRRFESSSPHPGVYGPCVPITRQRTGAARNQAISRGKRPPKGRPRPAASRSQSSPGPRKRTTARLPAGRGWSQ